MRVEFSLTQIKHEG